MVNNLIILAIHEDSAIIKNFQGAIPFMTLRHFPSAFNDSSVYSCTHVLLSLHKQGKINLNLIMDHSSANISSCIACFPENIFSIQALKEVVDTVPELLSKPVYSPEQLCIIRCLLMKDKPKKLKLAEIVLSKQDLTQLPLPYLHSVINSVLDKKEVVESMVKNPTFRTTCRWEEKQTIADNFPEFIEHLTGDEPYNQYETTALGRDGSGLNVQMQH